MTTSLTLFAGDTSYINFGGQFSGKEIVEDIENDGTSNVFLGVGGALLVLGGLGLGVYTFLRGRKVDIPDM